MFIKLKRHSDIVVSNFITSCQLDSLFYHYDNTYKDFTYHDFTNNINKFALHTCFLFTVKINSFLSKFSYI
jgi:hypothetical protein